MKNSNDRKWFDEINVFRALIIIWVVIGHSYEATKNPTFFGFIKEYAYIFHMNAFFMLSGFLFHKCRNIKSKEMAIQELFKKTKRLLIPYFFCSVITLGAKVVFATYARNSIQWESLFTDLLLGINNPNGGIWFLHTLFILSFFAIIVCKVPGTIIFIVTIVLKFLSILGMLKGVPIIEQMGQYSIFYFTGMFIYPSYEQIRTYLKEKLCAQAVWKMSICLVISFVISYWRIYEIERVPFFNFVIAVYNICTWYLLAFVIIRNEKIKSVLNMIGKYGMDIYIIGYYVQNGIYIFLGKICEVPYLIYAQLICILGLILPILFSKYYIRKYRLTRILLLGDYSKD